MHKLSKKSNDRLSTGHELMQKVVRRAIEITEVDFGVYEVLREHERQLALVASGKSFTMNSRHLTGHAADLWAWVEGKVSWDWEHYYAIAKAMKQAAEELGVDIVWGGVWDKEMSELGDDLEAEVKAYSARRKALRPDKKVLLDGPHFQLGWRRYPR